MENIQFTQPTVTNFVNYMMDCGGTVANTGFAAFSTEFPSYCNPSIHWDGERFYLNQRTVSYYIHATKKDNYDSWGTLHYVIPAERYNWLETVNWMGVSHDPMKGFDFKKIEMKERVHQWEFHGLEDIRVVTWNNTLYGIGVRRDDNPTGRGRMEICELDPETFAEIKSVKLKAVDENTYCVKNWMPVTDMPFHFIDTANPLRIVKADPETGDVEVVVQKEKQPILEGFDMPRGSSQCIPFKDGHLCIIHTCQMYYTGNKRKYARYLHAFIHYDKDWNIDKVSPLFSFDDLMIEFCCGMTHKDNDIYISFALQDNMSYVLKVDDGAIWRFVCGALREEVDDYPIWGEKPSQNALFGYAMDLFRKKDYAGAYTWFQKATDLYDYTYDEMYMMARSVADMGHRDKEEIGLWVLCVEHDPERPEGLLGTAAYYWWRGHYPEAMYWAKKAMEKYSVYPNNLFFYSEEQFINLYKKIMFETKYYDMVNKEAKARRAF